MTTNECKTIRREIDEADLNHHLTTAAADHLPACVECRTFQSEQLALQGLMASLDTVAAPSDFYFRLRARLAREKDRDSLGKGSFSFVTRAIAAVALVSVLAVAGVAVKTWLTSGNPASTLISNPDSKSGSGQGTEPTKAANLPPADKGTVVAEVPSNTEIPAHVVVGVTRRQPVVTPKNNTSRGNSTVARKVEGTGIRESAVSPAPVLTRDNQTDPGSLLLVPLDARALKISINNGRGTLRTISLPTVSFGSQRLMARDSFLAPASSAKSVW